MTIVYTSKTGFTREYAQMLGRAADVDYVDAHMDKLRQFPDVLDSDWAYYQIMEATNDHGYTKSGSVEDWTELKQ